MSLQLPYWIQWESTRRYSNKMVLSLYSWKNILTFCHVLQVPSSIPSCLSSRFSLWTRLVSSSKQIKRRVAQSYWYKLLVHIPLLTISNVILSTLPLRCLESRILPLSFHYVNALVQQLPTCFWSIHSLSFNWLILEVCIVVRNAWIQDISFSLQSWHQYGWAMNANMVVSVFHPNNVL